MYQSNFLQRNESEVEGMAVAGASSSFVGDNDSSIAAASPSNATNPDDDGHKEGGKKKKNRCLSCKKKVGLTGNCFRTIVRFWWNLLLCELLVSKSWCWTMNNDDEIRVSNQNQELFMILQNKEDEHMLLFWLLQRLRWFCFLQHVVFFQMRRRHFLLCKFFFKTWHECRKKFDVILIKFTSR